MLLPELAEQLGIKDVSADVFSDIFYKDGTTNLSCSNMSSLPPSEALENKVEVATAQVKSSETLVPPSCLSPSAAPNFEPQEIISTFKMHYISKMWGALCEWVTRFSFDSRDNFSKLKDGVNMILEEVKGTNAINTSVLEGSVKAFFDIYEEYDIMKSSSSQKMTKEYHQKLLSDVQQRLIDAKEESTKATGRMEDLQATLANVDVELKTLSA